MNTLEIKMAQHLELSCVLLPAPKVLGPGGEIRLDVQHKEV